MTKELTTNNINSEMLQTLRNTVAPGLTEPEFLLFAEMCRATGLNPATKEIWAIKAGGRLQLMTGINGFLRIANSHPQFDGMEVSFEWEDYNDQGRHRKALVSCTVKVHRKDRKYPAVATAYWTEYNKGTPVWKQMPSVMLAKCAKSLAIREAFIQELGGLYTAEEMPSSFAAPTPQAPEGMEPAVSTKTGEIVGFKKITTEIEGLGTVDVVVDEGIEVAPKAAKEPIKVPEKPASRRVPTYYDISRMDEAKKAKAAAYLRDCEAKHVYGDVYRSPIRLDRLTDYVTEDVIDETKPETTTA